MGEAFSTSGKNEAEAVVPGPALQSAFIPGIDIPDTQDGFGLITPLGGGATTRRYKPYGVSSDVSAQATQLNAPLLAEGSTYNFKGLVGPKGDRGGIGPRGLPALPALFGFIGLPAFNSNFLTELPHTVGEIEALGTAVDQMVYTSSYDTTTNFVWTKTDIDSDVKSWNDSDINTDASFLIAVADAGIYVSTDDGDSWGQDNPDGDTYIQTSGAASGGKAVVLGETERASGTIWTTTDYGVNWVEKTVTL